jgi:hypothetical protein
MLCLESSAGKAKLFRKQSGTAAAKKTGKIADLTPILHLPA